MSDRQRLERLAHAIAELRLREDRDLFKSDFEAYAARCLKIRTKTGSVEPLVLNRSQRYLHERLEQQRREKGRVRALVLKGRQVGVSTYIAGRFYWRVTQKNGFRAFILTHLDTASDNLFGFAKRYHDNCPPEFRPKTGKANAKELSFEDLDSGYKVATAGSADVGRSETLQLFHGSEYGFWANAQKHAAGIQQAIADAEDTEAIFESTANGIGNAFCSEWKAAERGQSEYEPIFIPWYWHEEYSETVPPDWVSPAAWVDYGAAYGLKPWQVYWAWLKNRKLAVSSGGNASEPCWQFKQEFPANAEEAFQTSGVDSFIPSIQVLKARKHVAQPYGPLILGVDPARGGGDKTGLVDRQGRRLGGRICKRIDSDDLMVTAGEVLRIVKALLPLGLKAVVVDVTGLGSGLCDRLRETLGQKMVHAVNFSGRAHRPEQYLNRRAEIWDELRIWLADEAGVQVPDSDELQGDLCAPVRGRGATHHNSSGQLVLESKDHIKERVKFSPDLGDAAALTFAVDMGLLIEPDDDEDDDSSARHTRSGITGY